MSIETIELTKDDVKIQEPSLYNVVFLNDNVTTVQFVEVVLMKYFGKTKSEATEIIDRINNEDRAIAGVYYEDIAETKAELVRNAAKHCNYPFRVVVEEV